MIEGGLIPEDKLKLVFGGENIEDIKTNIRYAKGIEGLVAGDLPDLWEYHSPMGLVRLTTEQKNQLIADYEKESNELIAQGKFVIFKGF